MSTEESEKAELACGACKRLKRKCDRVLPECGLCSRTRRYCDYTPATIPGPSGQDFAALTARLGELEALVSSPLTRQQTDNVLHASHVPSTASSSTNDQDKAAGAQFPAALFLDVDCFKWAGMRLPTPSIDIPAEILAVLTHGDTVVDISREYFDSIHPWLPIISRKRIELGLAVSRGGPDIAMLFLAMKLLITPFKSTESRMLYQLSKSFLISLEGIGFVSQLCLQAMILLAWYEYCHAIYPAAWMTVGACARYLELVGISSRTESHILNPASTWTEVEERRRAWWGVFVLDRLICLGSRRQFALSDPPQDGKMPVSSNVWDNGDVTNAFASTPTIMPLSSDSFVLLCQAALLAGKAVAFTGRFSAKQYSIRDASELMEELCNFVASLPRHDSSKPDEACIRSLGGSCIIRSALFVVLDKLSCPEKLGDIPGYHIVPGGRHQQEQELQQRVIARIKDTSDECRMLAIELTSIFRTSRGNQSQITPIILDSLYCTIETYYWLAGEGGLGEYRELVSQVEDCLTWLAMRWKLADEYLQLAQRYDAAERMRILSEGL